MDFYSLNVGVLFPIYVLRPDFKCDGLYKFGPLEVARSWEKNCHEESQCLPHKEDNQITS